MNVYIILLNDFGGSEPPAPQKILIEDFEGASTSPVFTADGKGAAFLSMRLNGYESDKNHVFVIPDVRRFNWKLHLLNSPDGKGSWDRNPSRLSFSPDGNLLYLTAEEHGRNCLWSLNPHSVDKTQVPKKVFSKSVSDFSPLSSNDVFVSSSSLIDNSAYYGIGSVDSDSPSSKLISSNSRDGSLFGLSKDQVGEIRFPGAKTEVHAWVIRPSTFKEGTKYPLAYLVHGGPQGAWLDSWSTRWNPAVFAEQGYVVVAPNPTGSTGYGQEFTDAIGKSWGGLPYEDLEKGFEYIEKHLDYVDTDRAVALGASYG